MSVIWAELAMQDRPNQPASQPASLPASAPAFWGCGAELRIFWGSSSTKRRKEGVRVPRSFQPLTETRVSHLELECFSYTSQVTLMKWTDHYKLVIMYWEFWGSSSTKRSKEEVNVPHSFQLQTEIRVSRCTCGHVDMGKCPTQALAVTLRV